MTVPRTSLSHPLKLSWVFSDESLESTLTNDDRIPLWIHSELKSAGLTRPKVEKRGLVSKEGLVKRQSIDSEPDRDLIDQKRYTGSDRHLIELAEAGLTAWDSIQSISTSSSTLSNSKRIHGNFALSSCPGKKVRLASGPVNGKAMIARDLDSDFSVIKASGVRFVICCLNDAELSFLGSPWKNYWKTAQAHGMTVIRIPIIEGAAPDSIENVERVLEQTVTMISSGDSVLCHCRGGIGRAGVMACCFLIRQGYVSTSHEAISFIRLRRSPKAIETRHQEDFIHSYFKWHTSLKRE